MTACNSSSSSSPVCHDSSLCFGLGTARGWVRVGATTLGNSVETVLKGGVNITWSHLHWSLTKVICFFHTISPILPAITNWVNVTVIQKSVQGLQSCNGKLQEGKRNVACHRCAERWRHTHMSLTLSTFAWIPAKKPSTFAWNIKRGIGEKHISFEQLTEVPSFIE